MWELWTYRIKLPNGTAVAWRDVLEIEPLEDAYSLLTANLEVKGTRSMGYGHIKLEIGSAVIYGECATPCKITFEKGQVAYWEQTFFCTNIYVADKDTPAYWKLDPQLAEIKAGKWYKATNTTCKIEETDDPRINTSTLS